MNRYQKSGKDAGEWMSRIDSRGFAETVIREKRKYGLTVDRARMEALAGVLAELATVIRIQSFRSLKAFSPGTARGE